MNSRRAAIAGGAIALVAASGQAATSETPLPTFVYVLAVAAVFVLVGLAVLALIDRRGRRSAG
jgi:NADH:ubiquinone oxidoreductase subunit K